MTRHRRCAGAVRHYGCVARRADVTHPDLAIVQDVAVQAGQGHVRPAYGTGPGLVARDVTKSAQADGDVDRMNGVAAALPDQPAAEASPGSDWDAPEAQAVASPAQSVI
jgi:hypothetical protein